MKLFSLTALTVILAISARTQAEPLLGGLLGGSSGGGLLGGLLGGGSSSSSGGLLGGLLGGGGSSGTGRSTGIIGSFVNGLTGGGVSVSGSGSIGGLKAGQAMISIQDKNGVYVNHVPESLLPSAQELFSKYGNIITLKDAGNGAINVVDASGKTLSTLNNPSLASVLSQLNGQATLSKTQLAQVPGNAGQLVFAIVDSQGKTLQVVNANSIKQVTVGGQSLPIFLGNQIYAGFNHTGLLGGLASLVGVLLQSLLGIVTGTVGAVTNVVGGLLNGLLGGGHTSIIGGNNPGGLIIGGNTGSLPSNDTTSGNITNGTTPNGNTTNGTSPNGNTNSAPNLAGLPVGQSIISLRDINGNYIQHIPSTLWPNVNTLLTRLGSNLTLQLTNGVINVLNGSGQVVSQLNDPSLVSLLNSVGGQLNLGLNTLAQVADASGKLVFAIVGATGQLVQNIANDGIKFIQTAIGNLPTFIGSPQYLNFNTNGLIGLVSSVVNGVLQIIGNIGNAIGHTGQVFWNGVTNGWTGNLLPNGNTNTVINNNPNTNTVITPNPNTNTNTNSNTTPNGNTSPNGNSTPNGNTSPNGNSSPNGNTSPNGNSDPSITNVTIDPSKDTIGNVPVGSNILSIQNPNGGYLVHLPLSSLPSVQQLLAKFGSQITLKPTGNGHISVLSPSGQVLSEISDNSLLSLIQSFGNSITFTINKLGKVLDNAGKTIYAVVNGVGNVVQPLANVALNGQTPIFSGNAVSSSSLPSNFWTLIRQFIPSTTTTTTTSTAYVPSIVDANNVNVGDYLISAKAPSGKFLQHLPLEVLPFTFALFDKFGDQLSLIAADASHVTITDKAGQIVGNIESPTLVTLLESLGGSVLLYQNKLGVVPDSNGQQQFAVVDLNGSPKQVVDTSNVKLISGAGGFFPVFNGNAAATFTINPQNFWNTISQGLGQIQVTSSALNNLQKLGDVVTIRDASNTILGHIPLSDHPLFVQMVSQFHGGSHLSLKPDGSVLITSLDGGISQVLHDANLAAFLAQVGGASHLSINQLVSATDEKGNAVVVILDKTQQMVDVITGGHLKQVQANGITLNVLGDASGVLARALPAFLQVVSSFLPGVNVADLFRDHLAKLTSILSIAPSSSVGIPSTIVQQLPSTGGSFTISTQPAQFVTSSGGQTVSFGGLPSGQTVVTRYVTSSN